MSSNYVSGHAAEIHAADYLENSGFRIIELNWKTRYCEIDIVAQKDGCIYFVEVKFRRSDLHGKGLDYITPRKLSQMRFAAEMWVNNHGWSGEYNLAALGIDNNDFEFVDCLD